MCVLLCGLGFDELPTLDELKRGAKANPDGFGLAVVFNGLERVELLTRKTMDPKEGVAMLRDVLLPLGDRVIAWAWHARIATSGGVNLEGCHPHDVGGDVASVVLHNGILPLRSAPGLSDTATFARDVLPKLGGVSVLEDGLVLELLEEWATGSKLAILSAREDCEPITILNEQAGQWVGDIWYSNSSCWAPSWTYSRSSYTPATAWADDDEALPSSFADDDEALFDDLCPFCYQSVDFNLETACRICLCCLDCGASSGNCGCAERWAAATS